MKKYVVYPGIVFSRSDGDKHYISTHRVMELYGVNPQECVLITDDRSDIELGLNLSHLIPLYPRNDGNYKLEADK